MNWTALIGALKESKNELAFNGFKITPEKEESRASHAVLMSDQTFTGGKISAEIMFKSVDLAFRTECEIILWYDPNTKYFLSAGLGGAFNMYSIRTYTTQWENHALSGFYTNIKENKYYQVEVELRGSRITLKVEGIVVLSTILPFVVPISQVGLFCISTNTIKIKNYKVHSEQPKAFVVMQFSSPYNELYTEVIKPICDEFKLKVLRGDETYGPGLIIADIAREINDSRLIIAEVTPTNSNVYYEVGYAHALNKPTILIAEKSIKLPFDVYPFRTLFYENSIPGKRQLEEGFRNHIRAVLTQGGLQTTV